MFQVRNEVGCTSKYGVVANEMSCQMSTVDGNSRTQTGVIQ